MLEFRSSHLRTEPQHFQGDKANARPDVQNHAAIDSEAQRALIVTVDEIVRGRNNGGPKAHEA